MILLAIILLTITVVLIFNYLKYRNTYWERRGVPCIPGHPIYGNRRGLGKTKHFRDINKEIYEKFKGKAPFAGAYYVFQKTVIALDLDLIKNILIKDFSQFHDRGFFINERDDPLTGHLIALEGEKWAFLRKKLSPTFTLGKMKLMVPEINQIAENLKEACLKSMAAESDGSLDVMELCARFTTDVIGTCAFGLECNSLKDPNARFRQTARESLSKSVYPAFFQTLVFGSPKFARALRLRFTHKEASEFFMDVVRTTIDYRVRNKIKRNDFMDMMIKMRAKDDDFLRPMTYNSKSSDGLTFLEIAAQCFLFFLAGFDTSATTMHFCLYEMAMNQDIQDKLRNEILQKIEEHNDELTYNGIQEMKYFDQVLDETLRKYSVISFLFRISNSDYQVPGSDQVIERDTSIFIPIDAIHHDPELYPEPEKFDPSRFEPEEVKKRHPLAYIPFGDGPRNCIGLRFAKMQVKIGLAYLLKEFKVKTCPRTEVNIEYDKLSFVLASTKNIYLRVEPLNK